MTVLKGLIRLDFEDDTFVLVFLTFHFPLPFDLASFTPVRFNVSAEHVLLDRGWCDKCFPNFTPCRSNRSCGVSNQVLAHDLLLLGMRHCRVTSKLTGGCTAVCERDMQKRAYIYG